MEAHNKLYQRRLNILELLKQLKLAAQTRSEHVQRAKLAGSALGLTGSALIFVGVGLAFFSFGGGLVLSGLGAASSVAGNVTSAAADLAHWRQNKNDWKQLATELALIRNDTYNLLLALSKEPLELEGVQTATGLQSFSTEDLKARIGQLCYDPMMISTEAYTFSQFIERDEELPSLTTNPYKSGGSSPEGSNKIQIVPAVKNLSMVSVGANVGKLLETSKPILTTATTVTKVSAGASLVLSVATMPLDASIIYQQFRKLKDGQSNAVDVLQNIENNLVLGNY